MPFKVTKYMQFASKLSLVLELLCKSNKFNDKAKTVSYIKGTIGSSSSAMLIFALKSTVQCTALSQILAIF